MGTRHIVGTTLLLAVVLAVAGAPAAARESCDVPPAIAGTRPIPEGGGPTQVIVHLLLVDLRSIQDTEQSFEADIVMSLEWSDPRLVDGTVGASLANCRVAPAAVWTPDAVVLNERNVSTGLPKLVHIRPDGRISYTQRYMGDFTASFELRDFPFDTQELKLDVVSAGSSAEDVEFRIEPVGRDPSMKFSIADWTVGGFSVSYEPLVLPLAGRSIAHFVAATKVTRNHGFYILKVLIPLCLIVFMSWAVFWINPKYLPPQVGVSTSAVLTLIAFQFSLGYLLPRVSYLTLADRFLLGSSALVFGAFGEALLTSSLADRGREDLAKRIDRWARVLFPLAFAAVLVLSFLH